MLWRLVWYRLVFGVQRCQQRTNRVCSRESCVGMVVWWHGGMVVWYGMVVWWYGGMVWVWWYGMVVWYGGMVVWPCLVVAGAVCQGLIVSDRV